LKLGRDYIRLYMNRITTSPGAVATILVAFMLAPLSILAQTDVEELGRRFGATPPPSFYELVQSDPNAFQFSPDNGWIRRGRRVASERNRRRSRPVEGRFLTQAAHDENGVMTGNVFMPVFLILFSNTDSMEIASAVPRDVLRHRLYSTDPAPPYSVFTYYREVSNDLVNVYGTVYDWAYVPDADSIYEGSNNGLSPPYMGPLMRDIAAVWDDSVDFGQFDNDGADGIPNSSDDDGFVDAVVLIHPKVDGSCKAVNEEAANSIWAHRYFAGPYPTNDVSVATGDFVKLRDYIVQGGQGGDAGCTSGEPQAMGVVAHETGHLFGLADLYDTIGDGAGIGRWGLMGSGNQQTAYRPTHLNAFSKGQLGWVTEVLIDHDTTLTISPVVTSDTAYVLPIPNTNEYFLLENRQRIGSDSMLNEVGLLIWHVDSTLARLRGNNVNGFAPYAVALEQADGRDDLLLGSNRGDDGDPFPGRLNNRSFGRNTDPSSYSNSGLMSFVELDSITQAAEFGPIRLKVGFESAALIVATDTNAVFRLDGVEYNRFDGFLTAGGDYALEIDSTQVADSGRRRFEWVSWSNGQPRSHVFTASSTGDTIVAVVDADYELKASYSGSGAGSVQPDAPMDLINGVFLGADSVVTLIATVDTVGHVFEGWHGSDTTATGDTLVLQMTRPFDLDARFAAPLVVADDSFPSATMGTDFSFQLTANGGVGSNEWRVASGTFPLGLLLNAGGLVSGLPEQTGDFTLEIEVSSGSQAVVDTLELTVLAPPLIVADVLEHLVGAGTPLSEQDLVYLDLLGNRNSGLDVGDFLGWVEATEGTVTAEEMAMVLQATQLLPTGDPGAESDVGEGGRRP
jgi:M6 family metalloprotease-like protein